MKKYFLIFLIAFISNKTFSQEENNNDSAVAKKNKLFVGVSFGSSFPSGEFSKKSVFDTLAGFAKTGFNMTLSASYLIGKNLGVCAMEITQTNPVDAQALAEGINTTYAYYQYTEAIRTTTDNWNMGAILLGFYATYPTDIISLDLRGMIGFINATAPSINITGEGKQNFASTQEAKLAVAPAFDIGCGFRIKIYKKFCAFTGFDFFSATPRFLDVKYTFIDDTHYIDGMHSFNQPYSFFNLNFGVGFVF